MEYYIILLYYYITHHIIFYFILYYISMKYLLWCFLNELKQQLLVQSFCKEVVLKMFEYSKKKISIVVYSFEKLQSIADVFLGVFQRWLVVFSYSLVTSTTDKYTLKKHVRQQYILLNVFQVISGVTSTSSIDTGRRFLSLS